MITSGIPTNFNIMLSLDDVPTHKKCQYISFWRMVRLTWKSVSPENPWRGKLLQEERKMSVYRGFTETSVLESQAQVGKVTVKYEYSSLKIGRWCNAAK